MTSTINNHAAKTRIGKKHVVVTPSTSTAVDPVTESNNNNNNNTIDEALSRWRNSNIDVEKFKPKFADPVAIGKRGLYVRVDVFRNKTYINLRHYVVNPKNNELLPTSKGVVFNSDEWIALGQMFGDINEDVSMVTALSDYEQGSGVFSTD